MHGNERSAVIIYIDCCLQCDDVMSVSDDFRLRPDIRMLECGDIDGAALEKTRLEEKQRDVRKSRKGKKSEEFGPRFVNSFIFTF